MNHTRSALPFLCLLTFGCTEEKSSDTASPQLVESTEYYQGVSNLTHAGGSETSDLLARRTLSPATSTITEKFIDLTNNAVYDLSMTVDVDTNTFTGGYDDGSYTSSGTLFGDAWEWHGWESTSTNSDGTAYTQTIESTDTKDENGVVATKTGFDAAGQALWNSEEVLTPITEEEWLALQE